ncbi:MAG: hypothetical protein RL662_823 [Bacteroidota bacterium]|jgi:peptidoglycan/LPS O-acetylase OafA/YrhL
MGIAILWIMLFHSHLDLNALPILGLIKGSGYAGVDIFMLVSGFGIFFALNKKKSLQEYYKNRMLRILPYYIPIILAYTLFLYFNNQTDIRDVVYSSTLLSFWVGITIRDWYIPAILLLYILSPLYYHFFKKNPTTVTIVTIVLAILISLSISNTTHSHIGLLSIRIPQYLAGFWLADFYLKNKDFEISKKGISLCLLSLFIGNILLFVFFAKYGNTWSLYGLNMYPLMLTTIPLCMLFCYLFSLFPNYKYPLLTFFGTYTLTFYIFHEKVMYIFFNCNAIEYSDLLAFLLTVVLAVGWKKLVDLILERSFR